MRNVTLSLDETLVEDAKRYAAGRGLSLNSLVKKLIERELRQPAPEWLDSFFEAAKSASTGSKDGKPLKREEIYNR